MKKFFSKSAVAVIAAMILSVGVSAASANGILTGNGGCAAVIKCAVIGINGICDSISDLKPEIIFPGTDNDTSSGDSDIVVPDEDTNAPSGDSGESTPEQDNETPSDDSSMNEYEKEVIRLVNVIRAENGLNELVADEELSRVARIKSQDMKDNNYFSHTSPVYGSPFDMMKQFGISYRSAGENIARGQTTPQMVVDGWMNSSGHRANILNASYNRIGVGYVAEGNYWTQMFVGR